MAAHLSAFRTFAVGVLAFFAAAFVAFALAMWLAPPQTSDGHKTMALGHAFIALIVGVIASIIAMIADRYFQHRAIERAYSLDQFVPKATAREAPRSPAP
jgi:uncharacterized membrane protein